ALVVSRSVVQKLAEEDAENRDRDREDEVGAADRGQDPSQRLRASVSDLAGQSWAEHVVVEIGACDEEADQRTLDREHPVEPRRGRVERARTRSEDRARDDRDAERAPSDRPPAPAELA